MAGVEGQGQRDLFYALAGTRRYQGIVELEGQQVRLRSRRAAIQAGIMFLPDDRARQGVIAPMTVADNMMVASIGTLRAVPGWRSRAREREFVADESQRFSIKMASPRSYMRELSGGNQQKVLLARSLSNEGRLVVLFEPTQGVDVGVKADIYAQLSDLAARGLGVLIYSSDEDELSLVCDRVLVLGKGRVVAEFTADDISRDAIVEAMVSYSDVETQLGRSLPERQPRDQGLSRPHAAEGALCGISVPASYLLTQPTLRVWVLALGLLIFYFVLSPSSVNFGSLNLLTENALPLAWVAAGQMAVVTAAQIDLSVGSVMSLSTAIAATRMGSSDVDIFGTTW